MNEKQKQYMLKQQNQVYDDLSNTFQLPVFEDEIAGDEDPENPNYILLVYGDMRTTNSRGSIYQDLYVVYVSKNNAEVETTTLDIISTISKISGIEFNRSIKERLQENETDDYLDRVTIIFHRKIMYEC